MIDHLGGGSLGVVLGAATNGITHSTSLGMQYIDFALRVDGDILAFAVPFSIGMGLLGSLLPALSATRVKPLEALH